jgi:hypothetical protein
MSDNSATWRQSFDLLCDQLIGHGMSRNVYSSKILPDSVVKVEEGSGRFQNVVEWETWQRVKDTPYSRWFAACHWISPNGTILIMERTRPPAPVEYLEKMPVFLCDFKRTNYGVSMLADQKGKPTNFLVCHDYGTHLMFENGMTKRMQKAEWWDA